MSERASWSKLGSTCLLLSAAIAACNGSSDDGDGQGGAGKASGSAGQTTSSGGKSSSAGSSNGAAGKSSSSGGASSAGSSSGGAPGAGESSGGTASGGTASGGSSKGGSGGTASTGTKSAGCGKKAPFATAANHDITVDGSMRQYFLTPPTGYDPAKAYPLIVAFHGLGGNGEGIRDYYGLEAPAKGQAIFVYPTGSAVDGGIGWALSNDSVDVKLVDAIVADLEANWCVDQDAVFATGFSYGGWMATQIACARPKVFKGIAPIAGGGPFGTCKDPMPAMVIHGTADGAEPIDSGQKTRDHFRDNDGCKADTTPAMPAPCVALSGCKTPVLWCAHPGGHEIPDFAHAGIWSFFSSLH